MDEKTRQDFLDELCPRLRPIVRRVMDCACGCEALDFFRYRTRVWLETADIAHYLRQPVDQVVAALNLLTAIGILERRDIFGIAFYTMTQDEEILNALDQFWAVRDDWYAHLEQVKGTLRLGSVHAESIKMDTPFVQF